MDFQSSNSADGIGSTPGGDDFLMLIQLNKARGTTLEGSCNIESNGQMDALHWLALLSFTFPPP